MKIVVICFLVLGPPVSELPLPFGSALKFYLRSDCRTDFAVDVEDALGWAIEIFRPPTWLSVGNCWLCTRNNLAVD
jgi:hypothetical protein